MTRASIFFAKSFTKMMDCRVKPGNDGVKFSAYAPSRGRQTFDANVPKGEIE
jgi:hypothetical protein